MKSGAAPSTGRSARGRFSAAAVLPRRVARLRSIGVEARAPAQVGQPALHRARPLERRRGIRERGGQLVGQHALEANVEVGRHQHGRGHQHAAERALHGRAVARPPDPLDRVAAAECDQQQHRGRACAVGEREHHEVGRGALRGGHGDDRREDRPRAWRVHEAERPADEHPGPEAVAAAARPESLEWRQRTLHEEAEARPQQREPEARQHHHRGGAHEAIGEPHAVDHGGQRDDRHRVRGDEIRGSRRCGRRRPPAELAESRAGSTGSTHGVSAVPAPASSAKIASRTIPAHYRRPAFRFRELGLSANMAAMSEQTASPPSTAELACVDGRTMPAEEATIPATDEGLLRGDGVFEVIRVYDGRPFAVGRPSRSHRALGGEHAARGRAPRRARGRDPRRCWRWRGGDGFDGLLRVVLTRGGRRLLLTEPLPVTPERLRLGVVEYAPTRVLDGVKSLSYGANMLCGRLARERGFDEALLVTPHGRVLEAPTSSLFWADARRATVHAAAQRAHPRVDHAGPGARGGVGGGADLHDGRSARGHARRSSRRPPARRSRSPRSRTSSCSRGSARSEARAALRGRIEEELAAP